MAIIGCYPLIILDLSWLQLSFYRPLFTDESQCLSHSYAPLLLCLSTSAHKKFLSTLDDHPCFPYESSMCPCMSSYWSTLEVRTLGQRSPELWVLHVYDLLELPMELECKSIQRQYG